MISFSDHDHGAAPGRVIQVNGKTFLILDRIVRQEEGVGGYVEATWYAAKPLDAVAGSPTLFVLGADDPEMQAIYRLLDEHGIPRALAMAAGARVTPATANKAEYVFASSTLDEFDEVVLVECRVPAPEGPRVTIIDHHTPGDPGYGKPSTEFLAASSIGQVLSLLASRLPEWPDGRFEGVSIAPGEFRHHGALGWIVGVQPGSRGDDCAVVPPEIVLCAAADHCLGAAYRGECLGVAPDALLAWRAASRAKFQNRPVADVLADVKATLAAFRAAPEIELLDVGHNPPPGVDATLYYSYEREHRLIPTVTDMRREAPWPELQEAALRYGGAYLAGPITDRDGRRKLVISGHEIDVRAFMADWAPRHGLTDIYGDPMRGFAGGYLP